MTPESKFEVTFGRENGGVVTLWRHIPGKRSWVLHVLPDVDHQIWGSQEVWLDGPIRTLGLGPLFSAAWQSL
jgi:hypothetical protein